MSNELTRWAYDNYKHEGIRAARQVSKSGLRTQEAIHEQISQIVQRTREINDRNAQVLHTSSQTVIQIDARKLPNLLTVFKNKPDRKNKDRQHYKEYFKFRRLRRPIFPPCFITGVINSITSTWQISEACSLEIQASLQHKATIEPSLATAASYHLSPYLSTTLTGSLGSDPSVEGAVAYQLSQAMRVESSLSTPLPLELDGDKTVSISLHRQLGQRSNAHMSATAAPGGPSINVGASHQVNKRNRVEGTVITTPSNSLARIKVSRKFLSSSAMVYAQLLLFLPPVDQVELSELHLRSPPGQLTLGISRALFRGTVIGAAGVFSISSSLMLRSLS